MTIRFILASQSPARLRTLRDAGLVPEVIVSEVDEEALTAQASASGADTAALVLTLAAAKAEAVAATVTGTALVLGCDSMLDLDGVAFGKPEDAQTAARRWRTMRGREGVLRTGHTLIDTGTGRAAHASVATTVRFAEITDTEIDRYCASGEPARVAGGFTIDGLGGWFIESIDGDHHNVVGLSLPALRHLLHQLGYSLTDLGYPARC